MCQTVQMKRIGNIILNAAGVTPCGRLIKLKHHAALACLAAGLVLQTATLNCAAQTTPSLPPGIQDVVKLVKAGLGEEVVLAHIRNAGASYTLSADQIIYVHEQGVSENEMKALLGAGNPTVPPNPAPALAPTPAVRSEEHTPELQSP